MSKLKWYSFPRKFLPDVLLSADAPEIYGRRLWSFPEVSPQELLLGYPEESDFSQADIPSLLVLPEEKSAELLAWLKTYAPETFPLSQFGRVLTFRDAKAITHPSVHNLKYSRSLGRWSSIILGEILAQGDMDSAIGSLPLSRSHATFSNAVARAILCHASDEIVRDCVSRLEELETNRGFVSRALSVKKLIPLWETTTEAWSGEKPLSSFSGLLDSILPAQSDMFYRDSDTSSIKSHPDLFSDSVEARVLSFRRILSVAETTNDSSATFVAANIAAAAFLVGRSTSHIFLLKDIAKKLPEVYVWFGLIAGVAGARYWEVEWVHAVKGIEKNLRSKLSWTEPSSCDISWAEYLWMSKTYIHKSPFIDIPKQLPKVLSLEIVPGAMCQFRLRQDSNNNISSIETASERDASQNELNLLRATLAEFIGLAEKAQKYSKSSALTSPETKSADNTAPQKPTRSGKKQKGS